MEIDTSFIDSCKRINSEAGMCTNSWKDGRESARTRDLDGRPKALDGVVLPPDWAATDGHVAVLDHVYLWIS